jgi:hypothetical protein
LPTTANVDARDFKHLACWLIVQIGPISLNVTTPLGHLEVHDPREVPDGPGAIQALSYKLSGYTLDNIH